MDGHNDNDICVCRMCILSMKIADVRSNLGGGETARPHVIPLTCHGVLTDYNKLRSHGSFEWPPSSSRRLRPQEMDLARWRRMYQGETDVIDSVLQSAKNPQLFSDHSELISVFRGRSSTQSPAPTKPAYLLWSQSLMRDQADDRRMLL